MKSKYLAGVSLVAVLGVGLITAGTAEVPYVAHEWGTFTSFQGSDGDLQMWKPFKTAELPKFVYDWKHPGAGKISLMTFGKESMWTLQRMETPVIYFYSDAKATVDVSVNFPMGNITEWYPQASKMNRQEHVIEWSQIQLMPSSNEKLASDESGSHYFAARETDADIVRSTSGSTTVAPEYEKFLFYRGAGDFGTPLRVTMKTDDAVTLKNTGKKPLEHLFVLGIKDKSGKFVYVDALPAGGEKTVSLNLESDMVPAAKLASDISGKMAHSLEKSGLFRREAKAMVNTWRDSWFAENGVRVLYVLPRTWTDATLPMKLNTAPKQLVRVMVGRAEILPPPTERMLILDIGKARTGDKEASAKAAKLLKSLGRFADPAFNRALFQLKPSILDQQKLASILSASQAPD